MALSTGAMQPGLRLAAYCAIHGFDGFSLESGVLTKDIEQSVQNLHAGYLQALGDGDMARVAEHFSFPAVFKGFLDDLVLVNDAASLSDTYERLLAAAPKAARTELLRTEVDYLRPGVYSLTMVYNQFDAKDELLHSGRALYLVKAESNALRLFAVL